jgi:hypothetical protein
MVNLWIIQYKYKQTTMIPHGGPAIIFFLSSRASFSFHEAKAEMAEDGEFVNPVAEKYGCTSTATFRKYWNLGSCRVKRASSNKRLYLGEDSGF